MTPPTRGKGKILQNFQNEMCRFERKVATKALKQGVLHMSTKDPEPFEESTRASFDFQVNRVGVSGLKIACFSAIWVS